MVRYYEFRVGDKRKTRSGVVATTNLGKFKKAFKGATYFTTEKVSKRRATKDIKDYGLTAEFGKQNLFRGYYTKRKHSS